MGASAKGEEFEIQIPAFEACYTKQGGITNAVADSQTVKVYPNPVKAGESVNISVEKGSIISLYTTNGSLIRKFNASDNTELDTEGLEKGIYILKTAQTNGYSTNKIIIL